MTTPVFAPCKCGHLKARHEAAGLAPQCIVDGCSCLNYRPDVSDRPERPVPFATPARPVDQPARPSLIAAGRASSNKSIRALADKVDEQMRTLAQRLREDESNAAARAEVQRLERELAAAKARLKGESKTPPSSAPKPPKAAGTYPCLADGCDRTFERSQARASHTRITHEGFDMRAAGQATAVV